MIVELKHIKELMAAMGRTDMKELSIEEENFKLKLIRSDGENVKIIESSRDYVGEQLAREASFLTRADLAFSKVGNASIMPPTAPKATPPPSPQETESHIKDQNSKEEEISKTLQVKSPMVGTFYSSSSPDEPTFVKVGESIDANTVVCIVEAMKVMNEIKAGVSGTVQEILVENGHPVEFGTPLFKIV
jgi:acetyl-CoA carboxylase biotin carboxyl carrier protein